jgi:hypothetical protein
MNERKKLEGFLDEEHQRMSRITNWKEKYADIKDSVDRSIIDSSNVQKYRFEWQIGRSGKLVPACYEGFVKFYRISTGTCEKMVRQLKAGKLQSVGDLRFSDRFPVPQEMVETIEKMGREVYGLSLTPSMLSAVRGRNTLLWESTRAWLQNFVKTECQPQPNRRGEYHFTKGFTRKAVWAQYVKEMDGRQDGSKYYKYDGFLKLWKRVFPFVKTRKHMAVQGKCVECAILEYEGEEAKTHEAQREVAAMYLYHSIKYRQERQWYHNVRDDAYKNPAKLSQIMDGMAQVHNSIPHYGRSAQSVTKVFDTHLQGMCNVCCSLPIVS